MIWKSAGRVISAAAELRVELTVDDPLQTVKALKEADHRRRISRDNNAPYPYGAIGQSDRKLRASRSRTRWETISLPASGQPDGVALGVEVGGRRTLCFFSRKGYLMGMNAFGFFATFAGSLSADHFISEDLEDLGDLGDVTEWRTRKGCCF